MAKQNFPYDINFIKNEINDDINLDSNLDKLGIIIKVFQNILEVNPNQKDASDLKAFRELRFSLNNKLLSRILLEENLHTIPIGGYELDEIEVEMNANLMNGRKLKYYKSLLLYNIDLIFLNTNNFRSDSEIMGFVYNCEYWLSKIKE